MIYTIYFNLFIYAILAALSVLLGLVIANGLHLGLGMVALIALMPMAITSLILKHKLKEFK